MASILKVDTLQKPDGSTPTAADLGLDVAGSVVNYARHTWNTSQSIATTTWTDVTGSSFTYTPKSSNSKLFVTITQPLNLATNTSVGASVVLVVDGVQQETPMARYEMYRAVSNSMHLVLTKTVEVINSSTSTKTIKVQFQGYDTDIVYTGGEYYKGSISILEIAQ